MDVLVAIREPNGSFSRADPGTRPYYSITKSFIAAAIVRLGVDFEQRLSHWFGPDLLPHGNQILVRHLLTHSAGLRDYGALPEYADAIRSGQITLER